MTLTLNFNMKKTENLYKLRIKMFPKNERPVDGTSDDSHFIEINEILHEVTKSPKTFHIFLAHKLGLFFLIYIFLMTLF